MGSRDSAANPWHLSGGMLSQRALEALLHLQHGVIVEMKESLRLANLLVKIRISMASQYATKVILSVISDCVMALVRPVGGADSADSHHLKAKSVSWLHDSTARWSVGRPEPCAHLDGGTVRHRSSLTLSHACR